MLDSTREFLQWWLSATWEFFSLEMPGFSFSVGSFLLAGFIISALISVLGVVFGIGTGTELAEYRSGPSGKARNVSERRKLDEY